MKSRDLLLSDRSESDRENMLGKTENEMERRGQCSWLTPEH